MSFQVVGADGIAVRKDLAEARRWYLRAAQHDEHEAMLHLGKLFAGGNGVE